MAGREIVPIVGSATSLQARVWGIFSHATNATRGSPPRQASDAILHPQTVRPQRSLSGTAGAAGPRSESAMQLLLILGIVFTIGAVLFALQNNVPVTVTLALWRFDGSLALVLLIALGLGVLIAALVSTPTVLRGQWSGARLRRALAAAENDKAALQRRLGELETELARLRPPGDPPPEEARPYRGLRSLLSGSDDGTT
ncbi:MAG: hypothetical protein CO164_07165 [Rhodocyclales bacterium CG_4_9_14_3_um_filter_68_10]|nr:MAG: hypothetical protein CO164_07165 [Rhodocyclales bacterium CG_4_9_14_3_um_filter_68_10]